MKKNLVRRIIEVTGVKEPSLRVTLSKIKKKHDLRSIEQAACFYIKKKKLDINVSSVIDDTTRQVVQSIHTQRSASPPAAMPVRSIKSRPPAVPTIRWMPGTYYSLSNRLADFYGYLFIFENVLRLKIDEVMRGLRTLIGGKQKVKQIFTRTYICMLKMKRPDKPDYRWWANPAL